MNVPSFNNREKGLEDDYIRKREAEKLAARKGQSTTEQLKGLGTQANQQGGAGGGSSGQGTGQAK